MIPRPARRPKVEDKKSGDTQAEDGRGDLLNGDGPAARLRRTRATQVLSYSVRTARFVRSV